MGGVDEFTDLVFQRHCKRFMCLRVLKGDADRECYFYCQRLADLQLRILYTIRYPYMSHGQGKKNARKVSLHKKPNLLPIQACTTVDSFIGVCSKSLLAAWMPTINIGISIHIILVNDNSPPSERDRKEVVVGLLKWALATCTILCRLLVEIVTDVHINL